MTQIELRCWAIDQAIRTGAQDVLAMAREILAFAECAAVVASPRKGRSHADSWTPERVALLVRMRHEGARTTAIRRAMNDLPGNPLSYNAVGTRIALLNLPNAGTKKQIAAARERAAARLAA